MRRSLLLRLLGLSLSVALLAVSATALLAAYDTGNQLRQRLESDVSQLETDNEIRDSLLAYADGHRSWNGVEPLVRELAERTGRRIALTTVDDETIVDSTRSPGADADRLPPAPAATIDAVASSAPITATRPLGPDGGPTVELRGWQLTEAEKQQRQVLMDEMAACFRRAAPAPGTGERATLTYDQPFSIDSPVGSRPDGNPCVPDELHQPGAATRELNQRAVRLAATCLDGHQLTYAVSAGSHGLLTVRPKESGQKNPQWNECVRTALIEAKRPYVAPPAELYLGTSDRFDPLSSDGWWRSAVLILLAAGIVTVLVGRRLVRPILALTAAARRMEAGDHAARVPVRGNDEVARLADAFNTMAEAIDTNNSRRRALASDVAHELRTPLANVRSHLEAAQDGVIPLDSGLVHSLLEESALLERLVTDLHDLALADAGMLRIHPEPRDAADLAGQVVAAHRSQADASGVRLRLDAVAGPVTVHADPTRLRQALGNLVSNAIRHTPAGGAVVVVVGRSTDAVLLVVNDTGSGIAPAHLPHVFDRFYRADPSRSRTTGGSGLGLAITKHLVEAHHGHLDVTSILGQGSVFTIRLPTSAP
ncbi:MAG: ATP-binding protein [Kibdelosporangium sp.]